MRLLAALLCAALLAAAPIHRSAAQRRAFMEQTGYPKGRPGWIVDHVIPLARGGCDCPENMMWQTREAAACKDRFELWVPAEALLRHYGRGKMAK